MSSAVQMRRPVETGVPDPFPYMHPLLVKNYGKWAWHDRLRPGVLHHVAKSGDEVWTVRAGTQRQMDVFTVRKLCDIADQFAEGHVRFTTRSNIEFMLSAKNKVQPLIDALGAAGFPVGGTGNSVSMISHTQGWLHCDIPGTDASGVVKSLMDMMHHEFTHEEMPNRVTHHHLVLPDQLRRPRRHLDQRAVHQAAEDQSRSGLEGLRAPRGGRTLPGRGDPAGDGQRQTVARGRREEVRVLRRLLPALPADADQRRGLDQDRGVGRRQALQRAIQADFP